MGQLDPNSRRTLIRRAGGGVALLSVAGLLAACGGSDEGDTTSTQPPAGSALKVSSGSTIPPATVKFGVAPFLDGAIYVIAMKRGWFKDVGIDIQPQPTGVQTTPDNAIPKIEAGDTDIGVVFGPGKIQNQAKAPEIKLFGLSNAFVGTYILMSPRVATPSVVDLVKQGKPFQEAVKEAFAPMKGKAIGLSNTGQRRVFLSTYFKLAGLSFNDVKPNSTDDARILQLARGGHLDYASPEGAAQQIALLADGWKVLASIEDLLKGLPPGDPRSVAAIGHEGVAAKASYLEQNRETCLRVLSVMYRTIDAVKKQPDDVLPDEAPYLTSVTGVKTTPQQLKDLAQNLFDFKDFEAQTEYWVNLSGPFSYKSIYGAQIAAAQRDGIIPKGADVKPEDVMVGESFYKQLVALRKAYDTLQPKASGLSGSKANLAKQAATQYQNRNYLDAYRMLRTAVASA